MLWHGVLALSLLALGRPLSAQTPDELLEGARAARDRGEFSTAASLTEGYLEARPDDGGAWWMLAQLRYWSGDPQGSRRAYRRAVELLPADLALRVDFARMLVGVGWLAEARNVIGPVLQADPPLRTQGEEILGDIRALTPPWLGARTDWTHDDQPRTVLDMEVEAGRYLTPLWTVAVGLSPRVLNGLGEGSSQTRLGVRGATQLSSPDGTWVVAGSGGFTVADTLVEPSYEGRLTLHATPSLALWGRVARGPYEWTRTSLDSLLMTTTLEVALDGGAGTRWAGAIQGRSERFGDDNTVSTLFGWLLAPVLPGVRLGYAVSWQDARASRWERDPAAGSVSRPLGRADTIPGHYAPYHTPENLVVHTILAEASAPVAGANLRGQLGVGVHATEEAPFLIRGAGSELILSSYTRSLTPWYLLLTLNRPLGRDAELELGGELRESSYYRLGRLSLGVTKRWP